MSDGIFRKSSVERLSSPENLSGVMRVVPAKNWAALVCLFAVAAAFFAWAFFGELLRQAKGPGVLLASADAGAPPCVIAVLSPEDGRSVCAGMAAGVVLDGQTGTYAFGQVTDSTVLNGQTVELGGESVPASGLKDGTPGTGGIAVLIRLDADGALKASGLLAAAGAAGTGKLLPCRVEVTVERFHPVKLLMPG
jgi:hypothetical protein